MPVSYEDQQDSFSDLLSLGLLIILLVYIVMAAQFEASHIQHHHDIAAVRILRVFPHHSGSPATRSTSSSMIGAIMLIRYRGEESGIVLIDSITLNRERGMSIRRAVIDGSLASAPVVMTTLTTILGMVPLAIGSGELPDVASDGVWP